MKSWPDPVAHHAAGRPNSPALITEERTWTWAEWDGWTGQIAWTLQDKKRVAFCADISTTYLATLVGALRAGATVIPLSRRWPEKILREAVALVQPDVLFSSASLADIERVKGGEGEWESGRRGERNAEPVILNLGEPDTRNPAVLRDLQPSASAPELGTRNWNLKREASIVFTSGSSGFPKAAVHTVGNHYESAAGVNDHVGLTADSRWLLALPLYHVGGLGIVFRSLLAGTTVVLPDSEMGLGEAVETFRPTHLSLVSTQLVRLLRRRDLSMSSVKAILLGGSRLPEKAVEEAVERGLPIVLSYGLTEMASTVTATEVGGRDIETSGRLLKFREVKISSDSEIFVRGETLFKGYLTEEGIEDPRNFDGWFATGDVGHFDESGRLVVTGRKDLRIVSGGENIQPEAVEAALLRLPFVEEAVVVPVNDAEFGQRPFAFVRTSRAEILDAGQVRKLLDEELPRFAIPVAFERWEGAEGMKPDRNMLAMRAQDVCNSD